MRPFSVFSLVGAAALVMAALPASADTTETVKFDPVRMWECTQADGSSIYTNKEQSGCKLMTLKELSVVPSLDNMPTYRSPYAAAPSDMHTMDRPVTVMGARGQTVPDWAQNWYSSVAWSGGSVESEVCSLYGEWINLVCGDDLVGCPRRAVGVVAELLVEQLGVDARVVAGHAGLPELGEKGAVGGQRCCPQEWYAARS